MVIITFIILYSLRRFDLQGLERLYHTFAAIDNSVVLTIASYWQLLCGMVECWEGKISLILIFFSHWMCKYMVFIPVFLNNKTI